MAPVSKVTQAPGGGRSLSRKTVRRHLVNVSRCRPHYGSVVNANGNIVCGRRFTDNKNSTWGLSGER